MVELVDDGISLSPKEQEETNAKLDANSLLGSLDRTGTRIIELRPMKE